MNTDIADLYVSRNERGSAIIARQEPVVYHKGNYAQALNEQQLERYAKDGFLVIENLFDEHEVQELLAELERLRLDPALKGMPELITEPGDQDALRSLFRVHQLSDRMAELIRDPRLVNVARQVLGSEVYVHQSRVNMKPGLYGKEFFWHSDFETWHIEDGMPNMRAVSCSLLLTDNNEHNGPLMLVPGSHRQFIACEGATPDENYKSSLKAQTVGTPDEVSLKLLIDNGGLESVRAKAGSVIFFECNTMHASSGNLSPWARSNVFTVFNSVENKLEAPRNGLAPRPEYLAARQHTDTIVPATEPEPDELLMVG